LYQGATLPVRQLRQTVRPSRTPNVEALTLKTGDEEWFAVLQITSQDQLDMFTRAMNSHMNNMLLNGEDEAAAKHRRLLRSMFGEGQ
jgi:hypothetical protein